MEPLDKIKEFLSTKLSDIEFVDFEISDESSDDFEICEIYANLPNKHQALELQALGIDANTSIIDATCNEIFNCIINAIMNKISNGAVKAYRNIDANGTKQLHEMIYAIASDTGEHLNNVIIAAPILSGLFQNDQKFSFGQNISLLAKNGIFNFTAEDGVEFNAAFYIDYNCCEELYNVIFCNYDEAIKLNIGKIEIETSNDSNSQIVRVAYQIDLGDISISKAYIAIDLLIA